MDLNSLRDQVSNLTLYDIKAGVRKVQNGIIDALLAVRVGGTLANELNSGYELHRDGG